MQLGWMLLGSKDRSIWFWNLGNEQNPLNPVSYRLCPAYLFPACIIL
jgi:hypothetical protein